MKGKDLFSNIQEARDQIGRLKRQAELIQNQSVQNGSNVQEFVSDAIYSLFKQEQQIQKKHKEQKEKLPLLGQKKDENPPSILNTYARQRRRIPTHHKHKREQSTKIQDSFSLMVQNRQAKMYSFQEKIMKPQVNADRTLPQIPFDIEQSKRSTPASAHFRAKQFEKRGGVPNMELATNSKIKHRSSRSVHFNQQSKIQKTNNFQLPLIEGQVDIQSKEFASFQRVYASIITKIMEQLGKIQILIDKNQVTARAVDGKRLAYLCLRNNIPREELLNCLIDSSLPPKPAQKSNKYAGRQGRIRAANKIGAFWKMYSIKFKYQTLRKNTIIIQKFFKQQLQRLNLQNKLRKKNDTILQNFEKRQTRFYKEFKNLKEQKHIQIHLSSVEVDEEKRLSMDHFWQRQNTQLARLFRLKDENLVIIFITAQELNPELLNYYYRMLELAGINDHRQRLIFMTPQLSGKLPSHLSTARLLYYSSRALNQLKMIISDLPTVLYPGQPCNQLIKICDILDCFLYSGEPQKMKGFMVKSQTKRLLKNLCIDTLPTMMEMYDYGELLNTFSVNIVKNPTVFQWVFKIDDELSGRGIAWVDFSTSKMVKGLLRQLQSNQEQTFATEVRDDPKSQEITVRIRDYLRQHLPEKLQIATPSVYRNYTEYMGRFLKKGGIIQAHPNCSREQLASVAATFDLTPNGQFNIITCYQKVNGQPFRSIASSFPQKIMDSNKINNIIRQLCDAFKLRKIFGVFTVDFLVQGEQVWVLGLEPFINDYAASYYIFDLLMNGAYMPQQQAYLVNGNDVEGVQSRQYMFIPHMYHRNLGRVKIKQFFKAARLEQFNFDIGNHEGICVTLLDQLTSGVLGLLSVANSREQCHQNLKRMLDFITRVSNVKNVQYGRSQFESSSDSVALKDVLSVFTGFVRKGTRRNAKQKAIKQYELNQNLQLIV